MFCFLTVLVCGGHQRPAVLFAGFNNRCDHVFAKRLLADGFEVNSRDQGLEKAPLEWAEVQPYNVLVIAGLGHAKADGSVGTNDLESIEVIRRFVNEGGGALIVPSWIQMDSLIEPQRELLGPWGVEPGFEEMVFDRGAKVGATPWPVDFSYARVTTPSPLTEDVEGIWIPVESRVGMQAHVVPFSVGPNWSIDLVGLPSTYSVTVPGDQRWPKDPNGPGVFQSSVPLVASRELYRGRVVVCGLRAQDWLWGRYAASTLEGASLDRGIYGMASGGYRLISNSLHWLSEPSLKSGGLGGAKTLPKQLENPFVPRPAGLNDWVKLERYGFPEIERNWPGVIGAQSAFSGGEGSVENWVKEAKGMGLKYLVFLEDFEELTGEEFRTLSGQCSAYTDEDFVAIPGFRIKDEAGNFYFYASPNLRYPPAELLSGDGRRFVSFDAQLDPGNPRGVPGQLNQTTLKYAYQICGFQLMAGNYLFDRDGAPHSDWFANYQAVGVMTREGGKELEDATSSYLKMVDSGQAPIPVVVDLIDHPEKLKLTPWRTVVRSAVDGAEGNPVSKYFGEWHFYPENPARVFVTEGPGIERWASMGRSDYEGPNDGNFVWENLRWKVGGKVSSAVGLREVAVYDGDEIFRRFAPEGAKEYSFTLDLNHDCQRNLTVHVTDLYGRRALSSELWNRNHRLQEIMCADRNNQLSYGYTIRKSDGTALLLGGNGALSTPNKRISDRVIRPSGVFKNDPYLGAAAFDGVTGNDPEISTVVTLFREGKSPLKAPRVGESQRLLHSGDVNIGESLSRYRFADGIPEHNVWHTLWKTEESEDLVMRQRNHLFQVDPDNPLSVTLVELEIESRKAIPEASRLELIGLKVNSAKRLVVQSSNGTVMDSLLPGLGGESQFAMGPGSYVAALDSPQGGCLIVPLDDQLEARWKSVEGGFFNISSVEKGLFGKAGERRRYSFLFVGVPRSTTYTGHLGVGSRKVAEEFLEDFGLGGRSPRYEVVARLGKVLDQSFPLRIDGGKSDGFSGMLKGEANSALPVMISGLNDHWSVMLLDRGEKKARPLGVFESTAWATMVMDGDRDLFIGHPVVCDRREMVIQLTQSSEKEWALEIHNPTRHRAEIKLGVNPGFNLLNQNSLPSEPVTIEAGASMVLKVTS